MKREELVEYTEEGYWKVVNSLIFLPEEKRQAAFNAMLVKGLE